MAAERKPTGQQTRLEHLTLVALYNEEEPTAELLRRLAALGVDTSEATTVRVELSEAQRHPRPKPSAEAAPLPPLARSAVTGAIIGGTGVLVIGIGLYGTGMLAG